MAEYEFQPSRATRREPGDAKAQHDADEEAMSVGLMGLAAVAVGTLTVSELLTQVARLAADAIPGLDGAGVTLAHASEQRPGIRVWAVTAEFIRAIDVLQYEVHNEGRHYRYAYPATLRQRLDR